VWETESRGRAEDEMGEGRVEETSVAESRVYVVATGGAVSAPNGSAHP
jgi:hypothetical protein